MPKNAQTTTHISHASKVMLKILQVRLQQYVNHELPDVQAGFRKGEEPEIKLPTSAGSSKKQGSSRKTSISTLLTMPKPLTVWITINYGKFLRDGNTRPPDLPLEKSVCRSGSNSKNWTWNNRLVPGKGVCQGCMLSPCLFNFYAEYIMRNAGLEEAQAGINIAGKNINNLRYADDALWQKVKRN